MTDHDVITALLYQIGQMRRAAIAARDTADKSAARTGRARSSRAERAWTQAADIVQRALDDYISGHGGERDTGDSQR